MAKTVNNGSASAANLGFEAEVWKAADALRSNMDAAEYKRVVLGLIFLTYTSNAFDEKHAELEADGKSGADSGGTRRVPRCERPKARRRAAGRT